MLARLRVSTSGFHGPPSPYPVATDNSTTMSTPALNFVAVCGNANLLVNGTKVTYLKALKESGAAIGPSQTLPDIKERFAALTWVRHAVANAVDPVTWPATLSAPLLAVLRSLYLIPPQRLDAPDGETDLHRLAHMVALFLPAELSTGTASATAPPTLPINPGGGINTTRPLVAQQTPALAPAASSALHPPSPSVINLTVTGKKRWLMHDDLHLLLSNAVYTALDSNSHLPAEKRLKLQEACKKSNTSALFDPATGAPFGHQIQLSLAEGPARERTSTPSNAVSHSPSPAAPPGSSPPPAAPSLTPPVAAPLSSSSAITGPPSRPTSAAPTSSAVPTSIACGKASRS